MAANSWMNQPGGFTMRAGRVVSVQPLRVFFNRAAAYEMPHMLLAAYLVAGFGVASVYAVGFLRGRRDRYHRLGFAIPFVLAAALTPIEFLVGDTAARAIAADQPVKFAAMEYVTHTTRDAPEYLGGIYAGGHVYAGLRIPGLDSLLVGFSTRTRVTGLDSVPPAERPPVPWLIHLAFDVMAGLGALSVIPLLWLLLAWWRRRALPGHRWFWLLGAGAGPGALVAMECRLARDRGWTPAVGRLQAHDDRSGSNDEPGGDRELVRGDRPVRRPGRRDDRHPPAPRTPLARRGRNQTVRCPTGRTAPTRECSAGRKRDERRCRSDPARGPGYLRHLRGADFGGGLWDLLAGGDVAAAGQGQLIDETITPVWEANHVWLIFALVIFWTAFPAAFAAVMTVAALPLWLAALGIVLRGAGFAFRKEVGGLRWERLLGATFAVSSLLTPFFMGTVVGCVAAGKVSPPAPAPTSRRGRAPRHYSPVRCSSPYAPTWPRSS